MAVFDCTAGQFTNDIWVTYNLGIHQQLFKLPIPFAEMSNPNRGIYKHHNGRYPDLRLGIGRKLSSDPPSLARRLALSRAIKASKPSRTKAVFSLTPVSFDAFSKIWSSMLSVVLICINMYNSCIYVNQIIHITSSMRHG
ncbi:hypothetical protein D3OALGA1CA_4138 [Olavius algarvensis associated proteobacterium Delta 3]|nr:hypothetical protein D3OALGB2SA_832 [Olavius algarvensis associated proteobacterium Delta 3]CAB5146003.1 hypothetical protein D3OALGA1CA_4138 [Olavius algarvensis associated proteobacterium Delta 3]